MCTLERSTHVNNHEQEAKKVFHCFKLYVSIYFISSSELREEGKNIIYVNLYK